MGLNAGTNYLNNLIAKGCEEYGILSPERLDILQKLQKYLSRIETVDKEAVDLLEKLKPFISAEEFEYLYATFKENPDAAAAQVIVQEFLEKKMKKTGIRGLVSSVAQDFFSSIQTQLDGYLEEKKRQRSVQPARSAAATLLQGITPSKEKSAPKTAAERQAESEAEIKRCKQDIEVQTNLLIKNLENKILADTILGMVCGLTMPANFTVQLIVSTQAQGSSFDQAVFQEINQAANISWARKCLGKVCYKLMKPLTQFYVKHFSLNFLNDIRARLEQFYNGNFNRALICTLEPINGHFTGVNTAYKDVIKQGPVDTIKKSMQQKLREPHFNGKQTPEVLDSKTGNVSIERYTPAINLRALVSKFLSARISAASRLAFLNPLIAGITSVIYWVTYPLWALTDWGLNGLAKWAFKKILKSTNLLSKLKTSTAQAAGNGQEYKHARNEFIVKQIEKARENMNAEERASQIDFADLESTLSQTVISDLETLVSTLLLDVGHHAEATNPASLEGRLESASKSRLPLEVRAGLTALGIPDIKKVAIETTAKYLGVFLKSMLKEELILQLTLTTLKTTNEGCFTLNPSRPTPEQMKSTELRRNQLLNELVTANVRKAIKEKLYPMKRIQENADLFVLQLHNGLANFVGEMNPQQQNVDFTQLLATYEEFLRRRANLVEGEHVKQSVVNVDSRNQFEALTEKLSELILPMKSSLDSLIQLQKERAEREQAARSLENLSNIFARLNGDLTTLEERNHILTMITQAEQDLKVLEKSERYQPMAEQARATFENIKTVFSQQGPYDEALKAVDTLILALVSRPLTPAELVRLINSKQIQLPKNETLKQELLQSAASNALTNARLVEIKESRRPQITLALMPLKQPAKDFLEKTLPHLLTTSSQDVAEAQRKIHEKSVELSNHLERAKKWASTKSALLAAHISVLLSRGATRESVLKDHVEALKIWGCSEEAIRHAMTEAAIPKGSPSPQAKDTSILKPFACENSIPVDLTRFEDLIQDMVISQIKIYIDSIPPFLEQEFNLEGLMRRFQLVYVNEGVQ